ncbi:hypothetical protein BDZ45DRAFT_672689, partial [Acephala macrosclerotiorum]
MYSVKVSFHSIASATCFLCSRPDTASPGEVGSFEGGGWSSLLHLEFHASSSSILEHQPHHLRPNGRTRTKHTSGQM